MGGPGLGDTRTDPHVAPGEEWHLGLLHLHYGNVALSTSWCISQHCFPLLYPVFGSPVVKPNLKTDGKQIGSNKQFIMR
jgi:hypothetical protein